MPLPRFSCFFFFSYLLLNKQSRCLILFALVAFADGFSILINLPSLSEWVHPLPHSNVDLKVFFSYSRARASVYVCVWYFLLYSFIHSWCPAMSLAWVCQNCDGFDSGNCVRISLGVPPCVCVCYFPPKSCNNNNRINGPNHKRAMVFDWCIVLLVGNTAMPATTGHFYYTLRNTQTNFTFSYFLRLLDRPIECCYAFFFFLFALPIFFFFAAVVSLSCCCASLLPVVHIIQFM